MSVAHVHHSIDYVELGVADLAVAKRFYTEAFGWEFTDYGPEYSGIKGRDKEQGGLRLDGQVQAGGPLVVLFSSDLPASEAAVRGAGGRIVKKIFSFPGGRRFEFEDPSGNHLAVWTTE